MTSIYNLITCVYGAESNQVEAWVVGGELFTDWKQAVSFAIFLLLAEGE